MPKQAVKKQAKAEAEKPVLTVVEKVKDLEIKDTTEQGSIVVGEFSDRLTVNVAYFDEKSSNRPGYEIDIFGLSGDLEQARVIRKMLADALLPIRDAQKKAKKEAAKQAKADAEAKAKEAAKAAKVLAAAAAEKAATEAAKAAKAATEAKKTAKKVAPAPTKPVSKKK